MSEGNDSKDQEHSIRLQEPQRPTSPERSPDEVPVTDLSSSEPKPKMRARKKVIHCLQSAPEKFPRCCACFGGIILPLWLLIMLALMGGKWVAQFEAPAEYNDNDAIVAKYNKVLLTDSLLNKTIDQLKEVPELCLISFLKNHTIGENTNRTYYDVLENSTFWNDGNNLNLVGLTFLRLIPGLPAHMKNCGGLSEILIDQLLELRNESSSDEAARSLTFNWIRCWDTDQLGSHVNFRATNQSIYAASQQPEYYMETWQEDQQRLEKQYMMELGDNTTADFDRMDVITRSIADATGRSGCSENIPGSAWFFFTVMTTIGYGNQAPETTGGRALVACLGFFGIFAFGAVSAAASQILTIVVEDLAGRCNVKSLKNRPLFGIIFWAGLVLLWIFFFASRSFRWWKDRLPDADQPYADWWESVWFAYISTTTVGLGDFYLQPAYIFIEDIFRFSLTCLLCFVFFAALIGKFGTLISGFFPDAVEKLERRVAGTNYTNMQVTKEKVETQLIKLLEELAEKENDGHDLIPSDPDLLALIHHEEELLLEALARRSKQLERAEAAKAEHKV